MISSDTNAPESITFFAASPNGVPAFTAPRSMSPVEICGMPYAWQIKLACVPFPAPGGPSRMSRMLIRLGYQWPCALHSQGRSRSATMVVNEAPRANAFVATIHHAPVGTAILAAIVRLSQTLPAAYSARTRSRSSAVSTPGAGVPLVIRMTIR